MTLVRNPRARFDYEIVETFTAGLSLLGTEVASLKRGQGKLVGSYVKMIHGNPFLIGAHIPPFQEANKPQGYDPLRDRPLLLTQKEIDKIERALHEKGLTLVPLAFFMGGPHIKLEVGLARGKKKFDKRQTIKKRDVSREVARSVK